MGLIVAGRRRALLCAAFCLSTSVPETARSSQGQSAPCTRPAARSFGEGEIVTVADTRGICTIEFSNLPVTLTSAHEGVADIAEYVFRGPTGRLYTYSGFGDLSMWTEQGKYVRTVSRKGQGPGELSGGVLDVLIDSLGRVYVRDNNRRWSIFNESLDYVRSVSAVNTGSRPQRSFIIGTGRLLNAEPATQKPDFYFHVYDFSRIDSVSGRGFNQVVVPGPSEVASFDSIPSKERIPANRRFRAIANVDGKTFWAGPPEGAGRGYELELWSITGRRLRTFRRTVPWFPKGLGNPNPKFDGSEAPAPQFKFLSEDGSGLLYVMIVLVNESWRPRIDVADRDKRRLIQDGMIDVRVEVIDTRAGVLLASRGPMRPSEAERVLPAGIFAHSRDGYLRTSDAAGNSVIRFMQYRLAGR